MKNTKTLIHLIYILVFSFANIISHGFGSNTYVRIHEDNIDAYRLIGPIYQDRIKNLKVKSYDPASLSLSYQSVKVAGKSKINCYVRISFNTNNTHHNFIECSPIQEFFVIESNKWMPAYLLREGDTLFCENASGKIITKIEFVRAPYQLYMLEVNNTHTFCVGNDSILTHNIPLPVGLMCTIGVSFGQGAVAGGTAGGFFGPVTIGAGIIVGGVIGIATACLFKDRTKAEYRFEFDSNKIEEQFRKNAGYNVTEKSDEQKKEEQKKKDKEREESGAQAPGKPTVDDGWEEPKNWNGEKVKTKKGWGYPSRNGEVWVPTGQERRRMEDLTGTSKVKMEKDIEMLCLADMREAKKSKVIND